MMPKGMSKTLLSEWIKTVKDKKKPIIVYTHAGNPVITRANLDSFKRWLKTHNRTYGEYIHKYFDLDDSYQVYLAQ